MAAAMLDQKTMLVEEQEEMRQIRLGEKGIESPCPFCKRPRVKRSDYVRCNPCGLNWLDGEDLTKDPQLSRRQKSVVPARVNSGR